jgi:pimeloyl-ACP methyl ester carboxylesterase
LLQIQFMVKSHTDDFLEDDMFLRLAIAVVGLLAGASAGTAQQAIVRLVEERVSVCSTPCDRTAVIFLHGITGSRETWGKPASALYWPKMLSNEPELRDVIDIYQVDYDSGPFSGPAVVRLGNELADALDSVMKRKRYSKVIFIAHSLGGIMAHQYLVHVKARYGHEAVSRFRMVITLGTPMNGSSLASIAQFATGNEQIRVLRPIDVNDFQQLIVSLQNDITLKRRYCVSLRTFAAFEKKPVTGVGIVVSESSATVNAYAKVGFDKNHLQLPKPSSLAPRDKVYDWATGLVAGCIKNEDTACPLIVSAPGARSCPTGDFD